MKSLQLLALSLFSLSFGQAETPILEEAFPSSISTSPMLAENEIIAPEEAAIPLTLVEADFSTEELVLNEEFQAFEQELSLEESPRETSFIEVDITLPTVDLSDPLNSEQATSIQVPELNTQSVVTSPPSSSLNVEEAMQEEEQLASLDQEPSSTLTIQTTEEDALAPAIQVDLARAFAGSPIIYSILLGMSFCAVFIWIYSILSLKKATHIPSHLVSSLQSKLNSNHFEEALSLCKAHNTLFCNMIASGLQSRRYGLTAMVDTMKAEGKRSTIVFWQRIGLLNDIAVIAPMLGLLGTVLGMFYAFYDINRSIESITTLFDGLGISVGTTVAGLVVAILSLILHSTAKFRLVKVLAQVENEAHSVASLIDNHTSLYSSGNK